MFGKRILILVAHPDDEVVACAAAIGRARAAGAAVAALYLSNGCLPREVMWPWKRKSYESLVARRRAEGEAAALALGILPVGWAERPARTVWRELGVVFDEVVAALLRYRPDQVWVPAYEGGNPDHDALNAIGFKLKDRVRVLEFAEYNFFNGKVHSQEFLCPDETGRVLTLTPAEQAAKKRLMKTYASEAGNVSSLGVSKESYRPLAAYSYDHPPHQGKLWYARFQWVPFRHPRVDFTNPAEVTAALGAFLSA